MKPIQLLLLCSVCFSFLVGLSSRGWTQNRQSDEFELHHNEVEMNWFSNKNKFWFRSVAGDKHQFIVIDAIKQTREMAFDHQRLADALNQELNREFAADQLPIDSLKFDESENKVRLTLKNQQEFEFDLTTAELVDGQPAKDRSKGVLFARSIPSRDFGNDSYLEFFNRLDHSVEILWIDRDGNPQHYATVTSGKSYETTTFAGHVWRVQRTDSEVIGHFIVTGKRLNFELTKEVAQRVEAKPPQRRLNRREQAFTGRQRMFNPTQNRATSPDNQFSTFVRDDNLWLREVQSPERATPLTQDATAKNSFQRDASRARTLQMRYDQPDYPVELPNVWWTKNSDYLLAFQTPRFDEPRVSYLESSPRDRLQPKLQHYPYAKPGDPIPVGIPRLFSTSSKREIPIDGELMSNPFEIRFVGFNPANDKAYLHYNQRGHQCVRLLELDLESGKLRTLIEELSETFIHYSDGGKSECLFPDEQTVIWASERSGWNHLYRYDLKEGKSLNPVTVGDWNVKRVELIDAEQQVVWFYAVGVVVDQDPYHEHFCRVNFDGTGFQVLTDGDGTHRVQWSPNRRWLVDTYSRVDLPPVVELRSASDGSLMVEVERADWSASSSSSSSASPSSSSSSSSESNSEIPRWLMPERFVAKGRDDKTDILGIVHWPRNFDSSKKYPIIENIYAGPHDHHVPKAFRENYRHQRQLADAGFVVVQIDGMGTAWRSKAFHDVCYRNLRDAGFPDRIRWIQALAKKYPQLDSSRVGIYGGSAGGQNAMAALLWHHDFYSVAVTDCGCHDNRMDKLWWNEQWLGELGDGEHYIANSNLEQAHLLQGHLMLFVGELDRNVDPASTMQVVGRLQQCNKDFVFLPIIGAGHGSAEGKYGSRKRLEFFQQHLGDFASAEPQ